MKWTVCLGFVLAAANAAAMDQERPADSLYVTGQSDSGVAAGAMGEVEWMKSLSSQSGVVIGGASASRGDASWTYGRLGGFTTRRTITLVATGDAGWGSYRLQRFPYLRYSGAVSIPVGHQIHIESETQGAYAIHTATYIVKGGVAFAGLRRTVLRGAFYESRMTTASSARWRYVLARADLTLGRIDVAGGGTIGSKSPSPDGSVLELIPATSQEWFGALSVASPRARVTGAFETMRQPAGRARRLIVSLRVPLARRTRVETGARE